MAEKKPSMRRGHRTSKRAGLVTIAAVAALMALAGFSGSPLSTNSQPSSASQTATAAYVITNNVKAPGRHLYIPSGRYVALGDSFSSGEGNPPFDPRTDHAALFTTHDTCHRSSVAYSQILQKIDTHHTAPIPNYADFVACSGAQIQALFNNNTDNNSEPPQLNRLDKNYGQVGLVTMTMGGNDVGFGPIIMECLRRIQGWEAWLLAPGRVLGSGSCQSPDVQHQLDVDLNWIDGTRSDNHNPNNLELVYKALRRDAPHARILVLGYPHEFKLGYPHDCQHIDQVDLGWANTQLTDRLGNVIKANIKAANVGIEYVDTVKYFQDYPLCGGPNASAFNGVTDKLGTDYQGFFHPNLQGQILLAQAVLDALSQPVPNSNLTQPHPSPSATPDSSCNSQTFLRVVSSKGPAQPTISGPAKCADGYALQIFTAGPGGQAAQFFFKQSTSGTWTLIEGGNAISTIACQAIPAKVLQQLGAQCPPAALATTTPPSPTTPSISPGHATPKEAVDGFFNARLQGNETLACSYASPASRASCSSQNSQQPAISGNITLHHAVVSGKFALIEVTGRLCYPGLGCESNTNPLLRMPASSASFRQVYDDLVRSTTYTFSPYPCIRVGGMWYINFGP